MRHEQFGRCIIAEPRPLDELISRHAEGWDKNSPIADPKFLDWKNDDFRLKPEAPAFKLGFDAIPVAKIGVRESACIKTPASLQRKLVAYVLATYSSC